MRRSISEIRPVRAWNFH